MDEAETLSPEEPVPSIRDSPRGSILNKGSLRTSRPPSIQPEGTSITSPRRSSLRKEPSVTTRSMSVKSDRNKDNVLAELEPQGKRITDHMDQLNESLKELSTNIMESQSPETNMEKIAEMSKKLTVEANALRESIKHLSEDISRAEDDISGKYNRDITDFPYHLFLLELIVNKIQMKCDCFDMDCNNLVISASFLGKHPIVLYDCNNGSVEDFYKINIGKSILFAMTYDKICGVEEFEVLIELTKQPPCSHCVTKIGMTRMDYTKEFLALRDELCKKWAQEQPKDNIMCTTSTPLMKNQFYLSCGETDPPEAIGVIEVSLRMSFLGKEITTAFSAAPKPKGTSFLLKEGNGMTMYSCQKVEMDEQGKILLDEEALTKREPPPPLQHRRGPASRSTRSDSPMSQYSYPTRQLSPSCMEPAPPDGMPRFDEIFTKMNDNELKIRVPKSTKVERMGQYNRIQELCECEDTPYNTGDQINFQLPSDIRKSDNTYESNLKYSINAPAKTYDSKDRRVINVTPTNCPVPVNMEKRLYLNKDVFILKIGKKLETKDRKTDLEIELVTPKAPGSGPPEISNVAQQVSAVKLSSKKRKGKKDKNAKSGKCGKGKKGKK